MGGKVDGAPACHGKLPEFASRQINGLHKQRSSQHTLARQKINTKCPYFIIYAPFLLKSHPSLYTGG